MRLWITRTEPGASRFARELTRLGYEAHAAPVLAIAATGAVRPTKTFDSAVFVSAHAVHHARVDEDASFARKPVAAIGAATTRALGARGIAVCLQADHAEDLLHRLATERGDAFHNVLLVKGEGGRDVVARFLSARTRVFEWSPYRRILLEPEIDVDAIDVIVCSSGDGVRGVAKTWFARTDFAAVPLLVPSRRVGDIARALGFTNIVTTNGANMEAVTAGLKELNDR